MYYIIIALAPYFYFTGIYFTHFVFYFFLPSGFSSDQTGAAATASVSTNQNALFDREKERQLSLVKIIEKVQVKHLGPEDQCSLMMNKYLSTPYHVALCKLSV